MEQIRSQGATWKLALLLWNGQVFLNWFSLKYFVIWKVKAASLAYCLARYFFLYHTESIMKAWVVLHVGDIKGAFVLCPVPHLFWSTHSIHRYSRTPDTCLCMVLAKCPGDFDTWHSVLGMRCGGALVPDSHSLCMSPHLWTWPLVAMDSGGTQTECRIACTEQCTVSRPDA